MQLKNKLAEAEAVLFAYGEPIPAGRLAEACGLEEELIPGLVAQLNDRYDAQNSALHVLQLEQCYQLCTRPAFADAIKKAIETKRTAPLSNAAMEALTIVAYNQPVTKSFVENVRGIDSSSVINNLVEKDLLEEAGRLDVPGKPIAYRTTSRFLRCFGLHSIEELPPLPGKDPQGSLLDLDPADAPDPDIPEELFPEE